MNRHIKLSLNRRALLLSATPLLLLSVQVLVVCKISNPNDISVHSTSPLSLKFCLVIGLALTIFLFIGTIRAFSRVIASRVYFLQENIRRARLGQPLIETESGIGEFDDLDLELRKYVTSRRDQHAAELQHLAASEKGV